MNIFASLHNGINRLIKTVEAFEENDISNLVRRKTFDLKIVTDHLEKAMSSLPAEAPGEVCLKDIVNDFKTAIGASQLIRAEFGEKLVSIRNKLVSVRERVNEANEHVRFSREEQKSLKRFCAGITHFRKTLVVILGIPPMYLYGDKANALTAALIYQKINTLPNSPESNKRYLLLLSLIEEEFGT